MGNVINGGLANVKSQAQVVVLVDSNGNSINSFGAGSGVISLNGLTGALSIGAGSGITIGVAGSTVTVNANGGGAGTITGPAADINQSLVRWSGVAGTAIQDSSITSDGSSLTFPDGGSQTLTNVTIPARIGDDTNQYNAIYAKRFGSNSSFILSGTNSNIVWAGKHLDLLAAQGQGGNFIRTSGWLQPLTTNVDSIGLSSKVYATGYFNQYATTRLSGVVNASPYNISWSNGSSQAVGFLNGNLTGVILTFTDGIPGSSYTLEMYNNASGTASPTFSSVKWQNGVSGIPTPTAVANDVFTFYCLPNGKYFGNGSFNYI